VISDETLMSATGKGDLQAFGEIVRRHQRFAWRVAFRFLGHTEESEDIVQDAFLKILDASPRYKPSASFRTYLYRIVARLCMDRARKMQPVYSDELPDSLRLAPSPSQNCLREERERAVRSALAALPPNRRMALILRHYEDLSYSEIAQVMGKSKKAVERLLATARASLAPLLAHMVER